MLGVVGSNLTIFKLEPTTPNMSQHDATWWPNARNMLRPTMLRYVAIVWSGLKGSRASPIVDDKLKTLTMLWRNLSSMTRMQNWCQFIFTITRPETGKYREVKFLKEASLARASPSSQILSVCPLIDPPYRRSSSIWKRLRDEPK